MNIKVVLWRAFLMGWSTVCALFLYGAVRATYQKSITDLLLAIGVALALWVAGVCAVWGGAWLALRLLGKGQGTSRGVKDDKSGR